MDMMRFDFWRPICKKGARTGSVVLAMGLPRAADREVTTLSSWCFHGLVVVCNRLRVCVQYTTHQVGRFSSCRWKVQPYD